MGIKSIVIIVLAMLVVLLLGYLLGQRRRNTGINGNYVSSVPPLDPGAVASVSVQHTSGPETRAAASIRVDVASPKQQPQDYSKQIIQVKEFHEHAAEVFASLSERIILSCYLVRLIKLNHVNEVYEKERQGNDKEAMLSWVKSLLEILNFSGIQRDINSSANEIAKLVIEYYDEQVSIIFSDQPFSHLSSRYALNSDLRESQIVKISGIICGHFTHVVSEIKELEQIRNWLLSNFKVLMTANSDDFDWEFGARMFGAGALAVVNPLIGIPGLIASFSMESKKSEAKGAQVARYREVLVDFMNRCAATWDQFKQCEKQTTKYVDEKFRELNVMAIPAMITEISAHGYVLDYYFESLTHKKLERFEQRIADIESGVEKLFS